MIGARGTLATAAIATLAASLAGSVALVAGSAPPGRLEVTVLAVGSAPAALLRTADGAVAVVDAGSDPERLTAALGRSLPPTTRTVDLVVLTGGERSAVAGLAGMHGRYAVRRVVVPVAQLGTGARTLLLALRADGAAVTAIPTDAPWTWEGVTFRCVAAGFPDVDQAGPVTPICALQLRAGRASALLLGDMAPPDQDAIASGWDTGLRSDLLVAPPGGALAPALVDAVRPRLLAVPALRPPRLLGLPAGLDVRTTAAGEIAYAAGTDGMGPA